MYLDLSGERHVDGIRIVETTRCPRKKIIEKERGGEVKESIIRKQHGLK